MLAIAIGLFVLAAVFGFVVLRAILKEKGTPKKFVILHGTMAISAIFVLIVYMLLTGSAPQLITSLIFFVFAALGGLTLLTIDLKKKPIPKVIAMVHPIVALVGLVLLIRYFLQI